jgi:hypothetical protein
MELVAARLGENLDSAIAQLVILRREGILIDSYFSDRRLGRNLSAGESVYLDLPAVGASRGSGESLQL